MLNLEALKTPKPIEWGIDPECPTVENCYINGQWVAWLNPRPSYCDRGHWQVNVDLPDIDYADQFPRYYMSKSVAIAETEAFLKWRLWKERTK